MARVTAYFPFMTSAVAPDSIITSRDLGLAGMEEDFAYGVFGEAERLAVNGKLYAAGAGFRVRRASICLNVAARHLGHFDPVNGLRSLRFFAGTQERLDVQAAVGALWCDVAQQSMRAEGHDTRWLSRSIDFRRADDYMAALPQFAAEVVRRAGFVGMVMKTEIALLPGTFRIVMFQRKFAQEYVHWAEFDDQLGPVSLMVPSDSGVSGVLQLPSKPAQGRWVKAPLKPAEWAKICLNVPRSQAVPCMTGSSVRNS